ncbi:MAG: HAMP domain-containing protein, partial [Thermoanaerobaculia bacterium]
MRKPRYSLTGKLTLIVAANSIVIAALAAWAPRLGLPPSTVFLLSIAVGVPLAALSLSLFWGPARLLLRGVTDGVRSFQENDFSIRLAVTRDDELGELVELYNRMGDVLRRERSAIFQRELLLDSLLQGAPMAIILLNERERVGYANVAARRLLATSHRLLGRTLSEILVDAPDEMRQALSAGEDALFTCPPKADPG